MHSHSMHISATFLVLGVSFLAQAQENQLDWTSSQLTMYYKNKNGDIKLETVNGPFDIGSADTSRKNRKDLWKDDGWELVCKEFGTPSVAPNMPSFVLYNKFRGIIRIFAHNSCNETFTDFACRLKLVNGDRVIPSVPTREVNNSPLFTFSANQDCFLNNYDSSAVQQSLCRNEVNTYDGWICADFVSAGFDPFLKNKDPELQFSIVALNLTNVKLSNQGTLSLSQILEQSTPIDHIQNFMENTSLNMLNTGYVNYRNEKSAISGIKNGHNLGWVSEAVGIATAVYGFPELAPMTASLAGAVTSFIGGGVAQNIPLNFTGKIQFDTTGILTKVYPLMIKKIRLNNPETVTSLTQSSSSIPWGVFNVDKQPDIVDHITPSGNSGYIHQIVITNSPQVLVNPAIGFTAVRKGIAFTFDDAPPGMMINPAPGNPGGTYFEYSPAPSTVYTFTSPSNRLPTGMALQLLCTLPGNPVLMPRENAILKVYPIAVQHRLSASVSVSGGAQVGTTVCTAAVHDSDPATSLSYEWKFNPVWGPDPNSLGSDKERYSLQEGGTFSGASVAPGFKVSGLHTGTLTVRDGNGFSTVTPVTVTISQPREPGGHH